MNSNIKQVEIGGICKKHCWTHICKENMDLTRNEGICMDLMELCRNVLDGLESVNCAENDGLCGFVMDCMELLEL